MFTFENFLIVSGIISAFIVWRAVEFMKGRDSTGFKENLWSEKTDPALLQPKPMQVEQTVDYVAMEGQEQGDKTDKMVRPGDEAVKRREFRTPKFHGRPHEVLGIEKNADEEIVMRAYKYWIKRYHPDRVQHLGAGYVKQAHIRSEQLNEARQILMRRFS